MPLEKPESGWRWLHVTDGEGCELVAVSDVETYWSHWVKQPGGRGQALRCRLREAGACAWCGVGTSPRARYVLAVRKTSSGEVLLMELGRVQFTHLEVWESRGMVGTRFVARKAWRGKNAPIELTYRGREHVSPEEVRDIAEYVQLLGLEQLRMMTPPAAISPSEPAERGRSQPPRGGVPAPNGRSTPDQPSDVRKLIDEARSRWEGGPSA